MSFLLVSGKEEIVRGFKLNAKAYCDEENKNEKTECTTCDTDGCNAGNSLTISVLLIGLLAFISISMY